MKSKLAIRKAMSGETAARPGRHAHCAGFALKRQEQIERMVCHLLKAIAQIKINGFWLGVYDNANSAHLGCKPC